MQEEIRSFEARLDVALNKAITIIKTEAEEQYQTTDAPRIAHEANPYWEIVMVPIGRIKLNVTQMKLIIFPILVMV